MKNPILLAICALSPAWTHAATLLSETFEANTSLPAGWAEIDPENHGNYVISTGHNGSGGSAGNALRYTADEDNGKQIFGGCASPPTLATGSQPFTLSFDFQVADAGTNSDDAVLVFGDLSDIYGTNSSSQSIYYMVVFNETATNSEVFRVTEGARNSPIYNDFAGTNVFTNGVWYHADFTWTPSSGSTGTMAVIIKRVSNSSTVAQFSIPSIDIGNVVQFGFGAFNDIGVFDNITINGTAAANNVSANNDAHTVGIDGSIAFDPTVNDVSNLGTIDKSTLTIITSPSQGTATIDPTTKQIVYHHTGANAGTDTLRYRISNNLGGSGEADVTFTVSNALRLPNTTVALKPNELPPTGTLQLVDAFPGLTFDGTVSLASVPGSPEKLIVASAHGASTGSDSKVWMIPNTAAASAVKKELFEVDSLCPTPFTRGRGIYSVVCHPNFATNGQLIVCYQGKVDGFPVPVSQIPNLSKNNTPNTAIECTLRVSRFTITPSQLNTLLTSTDTALLAQTRSDIVASELRYINLAEQHLFHSINDCHFGPDGYLYVSFGDEGDQGEPYRNAQFITKDQFSSMIRIDVDRKPENLEPNPHYAIIVNGSTGQANFKIPADNPYVGNNVTFNGTTYTPAHADFGKIRTEIWATGLRNPFKFDLDNNGGVTEAWIGDVGMDAWEDVSRLRKGDNGGWSYWEGNHRSPITHAIQPTNNTPAEWEYAHSSGNNCVIGGVLYRGNAYSAPLNGKYIFGDNGSGRLWTLDPAVSGANKVQDLGVGTLGQVVDFHVDPLTNQILIAQYQVGKKIMRLKEAAPVTSTFPQLLSQTGAFADLATLTPNPGVVPYEPNLKFWSDYADKARWFVIKNTTDQMTYSRDGAWTFPEGMIFIKHFDMELNRSYPGTNKKRLETRFLVRNSGGTYGISYRWNVAGTDATLVGLSGEDFDLPITVGGTLAGNQVTGGTTSTQRWHIPSRGECLTCHNPNAGHALSVSTQQLNRDYHLGTATGNMLTLLAQSGYLAGFNDNPASLQRFYHPTDTSVDLEERVRSYLAVNCSYCHQPNSGVVESWDARGHLTIDQKRLLYNWPLSETFHDEDDRLIKPGDTANSLLWNRIQARNVIGNGTFNGYSQMPPLATNVVDPDGVQLLADWINNHANVKPAFAAGDNSSVSVTKGTSIGSAIGNVSATDPDVHTSQIDQPALRYEITGGNANNLFTINPTTGEVTVNGLLGFGTTTPQTLQITARDNFAPNPKSSTHTLSIDLTGSDLADTNSNGIPDIWETQHNLSSPMAGGDSDLDGVSNFFEFLGGADPTISDTSAGILLNVKNRITSPSAGVELEWRVRNGIVLGQHYHLSSSTTLSGAWTTVQPGTFQVISTTADTPGFSKLRVFVPASSTATFFRLTNQP